MGKVSTNITRKIIKAVFPKLRYSQYLYEETLVKHVDETSIWLELGCGHQILPEWRQGVETNLVDKCRSIVGIDYDLPSLEKHRTISKRVRGDISNLPFKDNSFNLITSNMVLEHVEDPLSLFNELRRILKPGGKFVFHTPNKYGYNTIAARLLPEFAKPTSAAWDAPCFSTVYRSPLPDFFFLSDSSRSFDKRRRKSARNLSVPLCLGTVEMSSSSARIFSWGIVACLNRNSAV